MERRSCVSRQLGEEAEELKLGHGFVIHAPVAGNAQHLAFLRHPPYPFHACRFTILPRWGSPGGSRGLGGPCRAAGLATRKMSVVSQWGPSLATEVWSCQDIVKLIRGFQAGWKGDKNRVIVGNQPLYWFYGYCTLNLIQQELVKGEGDGRVLGFYESCMFCVFGIAPSH